MASEQVAEFDEKGEAEGQELRSRIARWVKDHRGELKAATPVLDLQNREKDKWRALYAIAEVLGGDWPKQVQAASIALSSDKEATKSRGEQLIRDCRQAFDDWFVEQGEQGVKQPSAELTPDALLARLVAIPGGLWAEYGKTGKPLSKNRLSRLLTEFGICLHRQWDAQRQKAGPEMYRLADFNDAISRYAS